uniref:SUN domain-containing protein n=1 Tax=Heterorhabditis bacteriophora TaxID=37862 RepID=A0A1I7WTH3_HETBA
MGFTYSVTGLHVSFGLTGVGAEMILTNYGMVKLERDLDHIQMIQEKVDAIENDHSEWHNAYSEQLMRINSQLNQSISMMRLEIQEELNQLREFISNKANATIQPPLTTTFLNEADIAAVESRFGEKLAGVESRLNIVSQQIRNISSIDSLHIIRSLSKRKYTANLASKAHGLSLFSILCIYTIAWCFAGSEGQLMIQLWANASIGAVLYEHNYWYEVVPLSAPKDYDVVACYDFECKNSSVISNCIYPAEEYGGPAQYCEMQV